MEGEERKTRPLGDKITHFKQLKDSEYLGHWHVEVGKNLKVTIESIQQEEVFNTGSNKKEWKTVARFKEGKKGMILNATNLDAIASHHGNNPQLWSGKEIEILRASTKVKGVPTECLRVKAKSKSERAAESMK